MRSRIATSLFISFAVVGLPLLALAQQGPPGSGRVASQASGLNGTLSLLNTLFNNMIALFITLAIVVFFWGLIKYLWSMEQENAHEGLKIMFWGLIAIFVMVSIWGLIPLLQTTFAVGGTSEAIVPKGATLPY